MVRFHQCRVWGIGLMIEIRCPVQVGMLNNKSTHSKGVLRALVLGPLGC